MDINIIKGDLSHLEDCYEALIKSEIGKAYFLSFDPRKILIEGLENKEIDVALDKDKKCLGFIWYERYNDSMIFLMTADFNSKARKLYESIGYKQVGVIPGFYRKDIDEYLMMKIKPTA